MALCLPQVSQLKKSEFGRLGVGKKSLGYLPTPTLPIEKSEFGRVGVGKKPAGFLPTPTLPIQKSAFGRLGRLGRVGVGKKPEPYCVGVFTKKNIKHNKQCL